MYTKNDLKKYDYFNNLFKNNKLEYVLDPLTGLISRRYMLDFVNYLIDHDEAFTLCILDLDNFKDINDNYGHSVGDVVLETIGNDLISYIKDIGVAGRYGGDEFLIILFNINDYDGIHKFFEGMYHNNTVLRKSIKINSDDLYYTGTLGSAKYPENAKNYRELFEMSDKTLYRGKIKGRNCYIIYVHEKHKDLRIQKLANDDITTIFNNIQLIFNSFDTLNEKLIETYKYLNEAIRVQYMYYIDKNHNMYDLENMNIISTSINLDTVKFNNGMVKTNFRNDIIRLNDDFYKALETKNISSTLIIKIKSKDINYGYIIYALERTSKIWQNNEIAVLMYLANSIIISILDK